MKKIISIAVSIIATFLLGACNSVQETFSYELSDAKEVKISSMVSGENLLFSGKDCLTVVNLFDNVVFKKEIKIKNFNSDGSGATYQLIFYDINNKIISQIPLASIYKNDMQKWGVLENKYIYLKSSNDLDINIIRNLLGEKII